MKISLQHWFSSNTVGLLLGSSGSEQSKQIIFSPSVEPTFVNVPQNNFVEPFVLNPGTWTVVIEAEGILLVRQKHTMHLDFSAHRQSMVLFPLLCLQDYLVLLPSAYYEAPILQIRVTEPCTHSSVPDGSPKYKYSHILLPLIK